MTASHERRTLIIVSLALFMVVLDNLVVSVALASIHRDFGSRCNRSSGRSTRTRSATRSSC